MKKQGESLRIGISMDHGLGGGWDPSLRHACESLSALRMRRRPLPRMNQLEEDYDESWSLLSGSPQALFGCLGALLASPCLSWSDFGALLKLPYDVLGHS